MTISGSIYFLGKYRPAYFEAVTASDCATAMHNAILSCLHQDPDLYWWLKERIYEGAQRITDRNCTAWAADHCDRGVSFAKRPHDPFMDKAMADMPPCPGLDYSQSVNR